MAAPASSTATAMFATQHEIAARPTRRGPGMNGEDKAMQPEAVTRLVAERLNAGNAAGVAALYEPQAVLA